MNNPCFHPARNVRLAVNFAQTGLAAVGGPCANPHRLALVLHSIQPEEIVEESGLDQ